MPTTMLTLAGGALIGTGIWLIIAELLPTVPDLRDVTTRLHPTTNPTRPATNPGRDIPLTARVGIRAQTRLPLLRTLKAPEQDLAILDRDQTQWLGEKVLLTLLALATLPALNLLLALAGAALPASVLGAATLALGGVAFFVPDLSVRTEAVKARANAVTAVTSYIDLVIAELRTGSSVPQAVHRAAGVAQSWMYRLIAGELAQATLARRAPWQALRDLGERLGVSELVELGDILRLAGEQDSSIVPALSAKAAAVRTRELADAHTAANKTTGKLAGPVVGLALIELLIVVYPAVVGLANG